MGLFRRKQGRHALGAAVTSIPSGPPAPPVDVLARFAVPPAAAPEVAAAPVHAPVATVATLPTAEPDTASSIAALLASGEAWAAPADVAPTPALLVVPAPAPAAEAPAVAYPPPAAEPATARTSLEAALAELLPLQAHAEPAPAPQQVRVQLGFRDGTSTTLDPLSSQALALEELAQSLTRRD